jgi:(R,R)-butanediol dehydrogenase/meso-butanediol dehydrogenase/diacetyl reductase
MKVAVFKEHGRPLRVEDVPYPIPGPHQAVIKVCRCGICATDLFMTSLRGAESKLPSYTPNMVIGHETAGEVVEVGPGVEHLKVGDHVTGHAVQRACGRCRECLEGLPQWCSGDGVFGSFGGFAEYSIVHDAFTVRLPKSISMESAALIEPLACALHGVRLAKLEPGARVLIIGAGPIGLGAAFWARHRGAGRVVMMARSERRKPMAMQFGGHAFISGTHVDVEQVINSSLGGPPEVVLECSGARGTFQDAINYVRPRGTIIEIGYCGVVDAFTPAAGLCKEATIRFSMMYSMADFKVVADVLDSSVIDPSIMITNTVNLAQLSEVFEALRKPNDECKVMVDPWG